MKKKPFDNLEYSSADPIRLKYIMEKNLEINIPDYVYKRLNGTYIDKPIISDPMNDALAPAWVDNRVYK